MIRRSVTAIVACGFVLTACSARPGQVGVGGPPPAAVAVLWKGDSRGNADDMPPNYERTAHLVTSDHTIEIRTPGKPAARDRFRVDVSNGPFGRGEYQNRPLPADPQAGAEAYQLNIGRDIPGSIGHNYVIRVTVSPERAEPVQYYLQYQKPITFSGITSPVLLRAAGNAKAFQLENLAPSVAGGVRWNTGGDDIPFISFNALLTLFSLPEESNTYALAAGGVMDLSGWLQIGGSYHFKNEQWYLISMRQVSNLRL